MNTSVRSQRDTVELLAPAGSWESLTAALTAGADAVYFGLGALDMRSLTSTVFTVDTLPAVGARVHEAGCKAYMTLNAVIFDDELNEVKRIIDRALEARIDAVIASDAAVLEIAKRAGMPIHLSTQANVTNIEGVKFYRSFADVMVLARELNLEQIRRIKTEIEQQNIRGPQGQLIRLEAFAHGAVCMAYSGKCYLSLHMMGSSANRGACLQPCRRSYILIDKENGNEIEVDNSYLMSAADLKTIGFIDQMLDAGIQVLKIEGRARSAEYVDTVIRCYREAIDSVYEGTYSQEKITAWNRRLAAVFNRGFWDGHYLGQKMAVWATSYGSKSERTKEYAGVCTNYYPRARVAEIAVQSADIALQDELIVSGPTTGVVYLTVNELRIDTMLVERASKGSTCTIPCPERVREGDKVYLWKHRTTL
ncbi:MAG: peptidase U32 family protein [Termitinemataceae bacterium]